MSTHTNYVPNLGELCHDEAWHVDESVEYRPVVGFLGYRIGDDGSVWTAWKWSVRPKKRVFIGETWKKMKPTETRQKRLRVCLYRDGKPYWRSVHRLVLEAFVGPCPPGMETCHGDGNRKNNTRSNLRWDTKANNERDKVIHGTLAKGERGGGAKLRQRQVDEIRELFGQGWTRNRLAERFGVWPSTIARIIRGASWR